ncbi:hypothetical protein [Nocardioides mesophilus]|uniref:Uncharacterized protein n=1 Tax=Nocardioides mesophilus TaxID=433659 RepID=A0A7G9RES9_9ACTN|nr:hypothetical protein [Nocardioides mesophilus]QNN54104.1 hypothetical protein H9L09_06940 [Nocardioides mesophilus]
MTRSTAGLFLVVVLLAGCGGEEDDSEGPLDTVGEGPGHGNTVCVPVHDDGFASIAWETIQNTSEADVTVVGVAVDSDRVKVEGWFLADVDWADAGVTGGRLPDTQEAELSSTLAPGQEALVAMTLHGDKLVEPVDLDVAVQYESPVGKGAVELDAGVRVMPAGELCDYVPS